MLGCTAILELISNPLPSNGFIRVNTQLDFCINFSFLRHFIFREKKWVTIGETTMKIYKWVPISSSEQVSFFCF